MAAGAVWAGVAVAALAWFTSLSANVKGKKAAMKHAEQFLGKFGDYKQDLGESQIRGAEDILRGFETGKASSTVQSDTAAFNIGKNLQTPAKTQALTAIDSGIKDIAIAEQTRRMDLEKWLQSRSMQEDFQAKREAFWEEAAISRQELKEEKKRQVEQLEDNQLTGWDEVIDDWDQGSEWLQDVFTISEWDLGQNPIWGSDSLFSWIGGWFSDENLKENIELVGESPNGINIYEFEYKDKKYGEGRYRGVMAQEVHFAIIESPEGYKVDYSHPDLDVKLERVG